MTNWSKDALAAPHTQRELAEIPQSHRCPDCGEPRQIIKDNETLFIKGVRLLPCKCQERKE